MSRKVVLVHGYSDRGASFIPWAKQLNARGYKTDVIEVVTYKSLTNEVTIKDLAEGFDRALRNKGVIAEKDGRITGEFDAIVHSTGMLVVRAWLTANRNNRERVLCLKHLIGFAPATWGSPLAHRGRGFLGSLFKGNKRGDAENAPDFLEAGDLILDGLELASRFTWELAHADLFVDEPFYGTDASTPYPFIFCGNKPYGGIRSIINQAGTDGTVRFAGVNVDTVKFSVDLTKPPDHARLVPENPNAISSPLIFVDGRNHGTILSDPPAEMVELVDQALKVRTKEQYDAWRLAAEAFSKAPSKRHQQFVIHLVDERGDGITDYHVELFSVKNGKSKALDFDLEMHPYEADKSFRAFHIDYDKLSGAPGDLWMRVTISSGTFLVAYRGFSSPGFPGASERPNRDATFVDSDEQRGLDAAPTEINLNLTPYRDAGRKPHLFFPFTTTLVEITVDREPLPFGTAIARLCQFEDLAQHGPWEG
jgi:hypothetical protein